MVQYSSLNPGKGGIVNLANAIPSHRVGSLAENGEDYLSITLMYRTVAPSQFAFPMSSNSRDQ